MFVSRGESGLCEACLLCVWVGGVQPWDYRLLCTWWQFTRQETAVNRAVLLQQHLVWFHMSAFFPSFFSFGELYNYWFDSLLSCSVWKSSKRFLGPEAGIMYLSNRKNILATEEHKTMKRKTRECIQSWNSRTLKFLNLQHHQHVRGPSSQGRLSVGMIASPSRPSS